MKKLIKLNIENTTNLREIEDSFCEVYSHDRNNGSFEFEITNDTLANETVTALFKFLRTGGYWKTIGTIEDNKIKVKFDTSLITQNEDVVCYLYLDGTERDSDIFSFKFRVKLSELDKSTQLVHKERYINNNVVIDRLNVVTHEDLEKVKSLIPVDVVNTEDLKKQDKRIDALESKADKDTVYDDTDLQNRVKSLEDKPEVDISKFATKEAVDDVAAKVTELEARPVTSSYDDSEIKKKIKELEDRPAGSGNVDEDIKNRVTELESKFVGVNGENIDLKNLVTAEELDYQFINRNTSAAIIQADKDIETFFLENTDRKDVDKIQVRGYVYSFAGETKIFKHKNGDDLEFVGFQGAMITLANVLPKDYDNYTFNNPEKRVTLLTDRNFKEMVATPEFKAVVKESLREIVKEIISENN
jgi:hypothetical protein|nr:MAG TPA: hypothetical protein [Caudoviricetes sp.]